MNCFHYRCSTLLVILCVFKYCQALLYCCLSECKCSVRIWCLTSKARKSEATAKGITNVRLGRSSGGTEVITADRGGSLPAC